MNPRVLKSLLKNCLSTVRQVQGEPRSAMKVGRGFALLSLPKDELVEACGGVCQQPVKWSLILLGIMGVTAVGGCKRSARETQAGLPPIAVQTVLPHRGEISRTLTLPTFRILPYQQATLYAKVSGYLKTISVDKGDAVKEGQLLAEIEVPEIVADEAQYKAETEVAGTNYERMSQARRKAPDLVVPQTVDDLRGQWEVARAKLQRARALLQYARIAAPFAGVITQRFVDPGAFIPAATAGAVAQNAALVTLMDVSKLRVQVFVPEAEVPVVTAGVPVRLTLEEYPGRQFPGSVTRIAYALDEATKTMLAEIELPNPSRELRPGMYASVQMEVERKPDALLLPSAAVLAEKAGPFVFRVTDGKARKSQVRVGFRDDANVEIVAGLQSDEPVILIHDKILNDGQAVTAMEVK